MIRCMLALLTGLLFAVSSPAEESLIDRGKKHWAFKPIRRPAPPIVANTTWQRNPIDSFILARLEQEGIQPTSDADRRTLLRRVSLDLTGLPPSPEEQARFLADRSPTAYPALVERLLASPAYGERWGRHWLDLARYADTNGYERDGDKPYAWRYRDWVVDAFNGDLPYDRMVLEQLAGDELDDASVASHAATTFLRLGTWDDEPANDLIDRYEQLDDILGTTTATFLAQTVRCARCHDHFFEPYSQKEYYELLAVFAPLKRPQRGREDLARPIGSGTQMEAFQRWTDQKTSVSAQVNEISQRAKQRGKVVPPLAERERLAGLERRQADLAQDPAGQLPLAYTWEEDRTQVPVTRILRRGNPDLAGGLVQPKLSHWLSSVPMAAPTTRPSTTGRRLALARTLVQPENPLLARVLVNRLWHWHFGRGIVATTNDFGLQGEAPSHPELLDWLASELIHSGWSIKQLHRLIVLSRTYQTSSGREGEQADRQLALFGRWRLRRLEAEAVRDAMLSVSGQLNSQMHGPGVYPPLSQAVLATQSRPGLGWGKSSDSQAARRSVYVFAKRSLALPELELLDTPDNTTSCECRSQSTTAPQALTFLNGTFTHQQAHHLARRLHDEAGPVVDAQILRAFDLVLCRPAQADEVRRVRTFLAQQQARLERESPGKTDASLRALASFCLVLLNSNEFFYLG
ncbi:MAG: DUF1549 and DUF1553 domain-containing protein [Gemmataceae bacterium]